MMRKFVMALLITCSFFCLEAQENGNLILEKFSTNKQNNPREYSYLNTDKTIYFTGGQLKFCVAILDQYLMPSQMSEIVYLELIHEKNSYRKKYVFRANKGILNERITLPMDLPTGNYQLLAYTNFMRNHSLEEVADSELIYIQHTQEPAEQVAQAFLPIERENNYSEDIITINIGETKSKVLFEIHSPFEQPVDAFFVSEGYSSIQFTGRISLKPGKTDIAINKDLLKGNFQKIILLDNDLEVMTARAYYLRGLNGRQQQSEASNSEESNEEKIFMSKIEATNNLNSDTLHLFKRIYKLYYNIPSSVDIDHLSFRELTSTSMLTSYSNYIKKEWTQIIQNETKNLKYALEKNIHLRGSLEGDLKKMEGAHLAVHFFDADLDMIAPLKPTGVFDIEIPLGMGDDTFIAAVVNEKYGDISDEFSTSIENFEPIGFSSRQMNFYPTDFTDSLISSQTELNYIMSTLNETDGSNSFVEEIMELERIFHITDYRNISNFEDFIREAVMDVTVVKKQGINSLNIYNSIKRTFNKPQMIILNDIVLERSKPLFDIPIDILESVNVIIDRADLSDLGSTFTGGILRVVTSQPVEVLDEDLDDNFGSIAGFYYAPEVNKVASQLNPSNQLYLVSNDVTKPSSQNDEADDSKRRIELILEDGTYYSNLQLIR